MKQGFPVPDSYTRPLEVVLVDDTEDIRLLLRLALEQVEGFQVVGEAGDGFEAIAAVRELRPDLVLLDLAMPRMDGLEALPALRTLCPDATILVLSGFEDETLAPMARAAGADGYLRKGASPHEIIARVRQLRGDPVLAPAHLGPTGRHEDGERLRLSPTSLRTAPFGLLTVERDGDGEWWMTAANDTAEDVLSVDDAALPARLTVLVESLGLLLGRQHGDGDERMPMRGQAVVDGRLLEVSLHGSGDELSVVLLPTVSSDDAARLRRAFAATAHEMRNPVTILIGAAEALARGRDKLAPDVRDRLFDAIQRQARLLGRSTADLMAAAQQEGATLTVHVGRVLLGPVLRSCADAQPDLGEVVLDCPDDLAVTADVGRLEQMVGNLLSNAAKYGAAPVGLVARPSGETVSVEVCDSGPGVAEEFVPQLFDEFSREDNGGVHGSGLGLYVVRGLAEAHGGTVGYSRVDGRSVFTLTLPLAEPVAAPA